MTATVMPKRGDNTSSYASYEELKHLGVPGGASPYIYKRLDKQTHLPVEERSYQVRIPVPSSPGLRKSLRTPDRATAISKAEEEVLNLRVLLKQGASVNGLTAEKFVEKFLATKQSLVRDTWEGKGDAGKKSITKERYAWIAGKLRNYLVPFLGASTDVRTVSLRKWDAWHQWRVESRHTRTGGKPKTITVQNEMGLIRECWNWGIKNGHLPFSPKLPFEDENLVTDDKMRRDTWEPQEWNSFARRVRGWLKEQEAKSSAAYWDAWVAYQVVFFVANCGMRPGDELWKLKRQDIRFYERNQTKHGKAGKMLCALVQVHKSTKTGARTVNAMGGVFAKRVFDKSQHRKREDFLFCHLDGTPFTNKTFRRCFKEMIAFTGEEERTGKHFVPYSLRHFYATIRKLHGTKNSSLCRNMGCTETYLERHYSHLTPLLAGDDLMRMDDTFGLGGVVIPEGEDFAIPDGV